MTWIFYRMATFLAWEFFISLQMPSWKEWHIGMLYKDYTIIYFYNLSKGLYTLLSTPLDYIKPLGAYTHGLVILAYTDTLKELCFEVMPLVVTEAHCKKLLILDLFCKNCGRYLSIISLIISYMKLQIHAFY